MQRGNNRQACFASVEDNAVYLECLRKYAREYQIEVNAWVLMANYIYLLCTSLQEHGISFMVQALGRMYLGLNAMERRYNYRRLFESEYD